MRSLVLLALVCTSSSALAQPPPAPPANQKVLFMKLRPINTEPDLIERIVSAYAGVINDRSGFEAVTAYEIADVLADAARDRVDVLEGGCEDAACWDLAIKAVGSTDYIVVGSVGKVDDDLVISLNLIDADTRRPAGGAVEHASDPDDAVMAGPIILARLFGWRGGEERVGYVLPEEQDVTIAALDLRAAGLDQETVASLSQVLAGALREISGVEVITQGEFPPSEVQKKVLDCADAACFAEIGVAVGADKVVVGHVTNLSGRYVINLQLFDTRSSTVDTRVTESFRGDPSQLVPAARFAGRKLLGVTFDEPGALVVTSPEQQATLYVNEKQRGALPMPALTDLAPGVYRVRVAKPGFDDWTSDIYVEPQGTAAIWAPLAEQPPRFYQTWWFWTGVGAVIVGTTTALVLNAMSLPSTELGNVEVR